MRPEEVLQAECYCILRDLLRVTQERPEGWQQARTALEFRSNSRLETCFETLLRLSGEHTCDS